MSANEKIQILENMMSMAKQLTEVKDDPMLEERSHFLVAYIYDILRQKAPFKYLGPMEWDEAE